MWADRLTLCCCFVSALAIALAIAQMFEQQKTFNSYANMSDLSSQMTDKRDLIASHVHSRMCTPL